MGGSGGVTGDKNRCDMLLLYTPTTGRSCGDHLIVGKWTTTTLRQRTTVGMLVPGSRSLHHRTATASPSSFPLHCIVCLASLSGMIQCTGPRLSPSLSLTVHDVRPPFSDLEFLSADFGIDTTQHPLAGVIVLARRAGCRTLLVEQIGDSDLIHHDNDLLKSAFPSHEMVALRRLTFWSSAFGDGAAINDQKASSLLGYAILKNDILGDSENRCSWSVYEALVRQPPLLDTFVPRETTFSVRVGTSIFQLSGILFCGQNGLTRTCAHTALRSFCSYALGRDVAYPEIDAILGIPAPDAIRRGHGLTTQDMTRVIDGVGLHSWVHTFGDRSIAAPLRIDESLAHAVSSTSGAILGFGTRHNAAHAVFIYGYTLSPFSLEHSAQQAYFSSAAQLAPFGCASLTTWITSFFCNDDNFGPYFQLPRHFSLGDGQAFVISGLPAQMHLDGVTASVIAQDCLHAIVRSLPAGCADGPRSWMGQLQQAVERRAAVIRPVAMAGKEYAQYLATLRDWRNEREDARLVEVFDHVLTLPWVWVIEVSLPLLTASYYKLGEVVLRGDAEWKPDDERLTPLIVARLPSLYALPGEEKSSIRFVGGNLVERTPFIGRGNLAMRTKEYDVALSFAGEDRAYAEGVASRLTAKRMRVFYDEYEKAQLWGKDLYQHLHNVYRDMATFCVVFISGHYAAKLWTRHELRSAQARAFRENQEYILPVRLDDTEIPGIPETIGYIDLRQTDLDELTDLLLQKLGR